MVKKEKKHILEKDGLVTNLFTILWHKSPVFGKSILIIILILSFLFSSECNNPRYGNILIRISQRMVLDCKK